VVNRLLREHPYALFIFSDRDQKHWHLVNVKDGGRRGESRADAGKLAGRALSTGAVDAIMLE
jgi:hypothetical protein